MNDAGYQTEMIAHDNYTSVKYGETCFTAATQTIQETYKYENYILSWPLSFELSLKNTL